MRLVNSIVSSSRSAFQSTMAILLGASLSGLAQLSHAVA
jgi:hypothetical protein